MIEKLWFRMLCLVGAAALGVWLSGLDAIVYCLAGDLTGRYATSIKLMLLGLPLFSALWFLRNHDIQSQLAQGEENRRQGELFAAFGWLVGGTLPEKVLGLVELKRLRDLYPDFKERIDRATRTGVKIVRMDTGSVPQVAVLVGVDLSGMDLSNIVLTGAQMDRVILEGTKLHGAGLMGAQMPNARLEDAEFHRADCSNANFKGAKVSGTQFCETNLYAAELENLKTMKNTNFTGATMHQVKLEGSKLCGAIWRNADLFRLLGVSEAQIEYLKDQGALRLDEN